MICTLLLLIIRLLCGVALTRPIIIFSATLPPCKWPLTCSRAGANHAVTIRLRSSQQQGLDAAVISGLVLVNTAFAPPPQRTSQFITNMARYWCWYRWCCWQSTHNVVKQPGLYAQQAATPTSH
jgi:hypothetical protein